LGLGHDGLQLGGGRAGLQWNRNAADQAQRDVDGGVVDAVEPQHADPVTGVHGLGAQGAGQCVGPVAELTEGDGFEARQQLQRGASGGGVGDEFDHALAQCRPVRVAPQDGLDDLRQR